MQLIDKYYGVGGCLEFIYDAAHAFLKLAAIFGTGHDAAHINGYQPFALQCRRHKMIHDALSETFNDGAFPDASFANQHGIVLLAAYQHLQQTLNLFGATHHRVESACCGLCRKIGAEFIQIGSLDLLRLFCLFVIVGRSRSEFWRRRSGSAMQTFLNGIVCDAASSQYRIYGRAAVLENRQKHYRQSRRIVGSLRNLKRDVAVEFVYIGGEGNLLSILVRH